MKLDDFVAVSGMSGIFRLAANRSNGLIVENLDTKKKLFVSARKHQFTPLASIGIYTDTDTAELKKVFGTMLEQLAENPPPPVNSAADELSGYFSKILPDFDRDRVHLSDIKKVIKWFNFLKERNLLKADEELPDSKEPATNEPSADEAVAEKADGSDTLDT